jgi:hypothetical protein
MARFIRPPRRLFGLAGLTGVAALGVTVAVPSLVAAVINPAPPNVKSVGSFPAGTTSARSVSFTFTEQSPDCFPANGDSNAIDVTILDAAQAPTLTFVGQLRLGPDWLEQAGGGYVQGNVVQIKLPITDPTAVERIRIEGVSIAADEQAASGPITALVTGNDARCVLSATVTAQGELLGDSDPRGSSTYPAGSFRFELALAPASCPFRKTGVLGATTMSIGGMFPEAIPLGAVSGARGSGFWGIDSETVFTTGAFTRTTHPHISGELVFQTVPNCTSAIGSPGTVTK